MFNVVATVDMFSINQSIFVYEDGNTIETCNPSLETFPSTILSLQDKYGFTNLSMIGPKRFLQGYKKKIEELEMTKYSENKLNITIL